MSGEYSGLELRGLDRGIRVLTLARPEVLNAFDDATMREFIVAARAVGDDPEARALIIDSGERAFSTGSDLEEALGADLDGHREHWRLGHEMFDVLDSLEIPVIAAVSGYALAGGCELALACDMRVSGAGAFMGLPEIGLGVIPSCGGTQRLPKLVGPSRAFDLLTTGRRVGAEEALAIGLIDRVAEDGKVFETALELAESMTANPPGALAAAKSLIRAAQTVEHRTGAEMEILWNSRLVTQPDFAERVGAFLARRQER